MKVRWIKNKLYGDSPKMGKTTELFFCGSNEKFDFITSQKGKNNEKKLGIPVEYLIWMDDSNWGYAAIKVKSKGREK